MGAAPFAAYPTGRPRKENDVNDDAKSETELRIEAIGLAVRHRLADEKPADIVKAAEQYLEFLKGK